MRREVLEVGEEFGVVFVIERVRGVEDCVQKCERWVGRGEGRAELAVSFPWLLLVWS